MLCDIIIPVWDQLAFTKDCINSILANTGLDYSLIIIDNGSDAQTKEYLRALTKLKRPAVALIRNEKNIGFIKAVNQGISASKAPYLCILNNDTLVTKGWLKAMIDIASHDPAIGIVNPSSNTLGQRPAKGQPLEHYAIALEKESDRYVELGSAVGFCMLVKKEVIERIGNFDEIYGMGNFEDTDFSRRAVKEGFRCVRACGAYVYHRENASFKTRKTFDEDFRRNKEVYEFRWGKARRIAYLLDRLDSNALKKIELDSMQLAKGGNWVWYFLKERLALPQHSNIRLIELSSSNFYLKALFRILIKKKRFDEIFVSEEKFGKVLEALSFIHKAKVRYY